MTSSSIDMVRAYDAVVVGAGPAGLSAAAEIAQKGRCLVVEQGAPHDARDRDAPNDVLSGVGGAGLFSDGKHSFFPAATALWELPDRERVERAFERTAALLARHGVEPPRLPSQVGSATEREEREERGWITKRYPSMSTSLAERRACIDDLCSQSGDALRIGARVVGARRFADGDIELAVERAGALELARTRRLVVATGRLSPRWIRAWLAPLGVAWRFRRIEVGVRIEARADADVFTELRGADPKLRFDCGQPSIEARTFCMARGGEVVLGTAGAISAFSGRADGPKVDRSSVGLLVRILDEPAARRVERALFSGRCAPFTAALAEILDARGEHAGLIAMFGAEGAGLIAESIARFVARFPSIAEGSRAKVYAPCIEGVGDYPDDDGALSLASGVWIAGDACGRFRGLVAGMVSGRYVGARITNIMERTPQGLTPPAR